MKKNGKIKNKVFLKKNTTAYRVDFGMEFFYI